MLHPQITWCAQSSMHYVTEASVRYGMPLYLAIQLKEHLKKCFNTNDDSVAAWISDLSPGDRIQVKVMPAVQSNASA